MILEHVLYHFEQREFRTKRGQDEHIVSVYSPSLLRRIQHRLPKYYIVSVRTEHVEVWGTTQSGSGYIERLGEYYSRAEARRAVREYLDALARSDGQDQPL